MTAAIRPCWSIQDSKALYNLKGWGAPYFQVNELGNVEVVTSDAAIATKPEVISGAVSDKYDSTVALGQPLDLAKLVSDLTNQGLQLPLLVHFDDILADRQRRIYEAFADVISGCGYPQPYRGLYPVKVNQQRHIVEAVAEFGQRYGFGLEAGSKPELAIALTTLQPGDGEIVCNGYKDRNYIQLALMAQMLGHRAIVVLENIRELDVVLQVANEMQVRPLLGVRAKLWERSNGHWSQSVGERAKFGLNTAALLSVVERLRQENLLDCLQLLHFHIGSQVATVENHQRAVLEAARIFVHLADLGAPMAYLDVGGGLSIDYNGSKSAAHSSCSYSLEEYARTIVATVKEVCERHQVAAPILMSESGRATVSHQSVLIVDVLGISSVGATTVQVESGTAAVVHRLAQLQDRIPRTSLLADFREVGELKHEALKLFSQGNLSLQERSQVEQLYWNCCQRLWDCVQNSAADNPEAIGLRELEPLMATMYYGNFSVFQSLPDSWAIDQVFPVMPIHRLDEEPTESATLVDLTCDSDGNLDRFVGPEGRISSVLPLHPLNGDPYWIGVFLTGAYQEILGDLHNLFGDTDVVHIRRESHGYRVDRMELGDRLTDVLGYVHFDGEEMVEKFDTTVEQACLGGTLTAEGASWLRRTFRTQLQATTYLQ
ncbi:MAG: biosynthetic arginine decarboxylase [Synechococcus sp.]